MQNIEINMTELETFQCDDAKVYMVLVLERPEDAPDSIRIWHFQCGPAEFPKPRLKGMLEFTVKEAAEYMATMSSVSVVDTCVKIIVKHPTKGYFDASCINRIVDSFSDMRTLPMTDDIN